MVRSIGSKKLHSETFGLFWRARGWEDARGGPGGTCSSRRKIYPRWHSEADADMWALYTGFAVHTRLIREDFILFSRLDTCTTVFFLHVHALRKRDQVN